MFRNKREVHSLLLGCLVTENIKGKPHPLFQLRVGCLAPQTNVQCRGEACPESFQRQCRLGVYLEFELAIDDDLANRGLVCGGFVSIHLEEGESERTLNSTSPHSSNSAWSFTGEDSHT